MTHIVLLALVPIFFVMILGYVAGRFHRIDNRHVAQLNLLVMEYSLPASLFVATASTPRGEMLQQGPLFAILGVAMLIPYAFWYFFRIKVSKLSSREASIEAITVSLPNFAAAGLPILVAIIGPKEAVHVAIAIAAGSILPSPLTLVLLELAGSTDPPDPRSTALRVALALGRAFAKPIVLAPLLGIVVSLSGFDPGDVVRAAFQLIGAAAGGVALFLTGLILSAQRFRLNRNVVAATVIVNVLQPLLVAALVHTLPVPANIANVAILLAALPSGFFGILFGVNYKIASAESGSIVIATTVFSVVTLAIAITLLYPQG